MVIPAEAKAMIAARDFKHDGVEEPLKVETQKQRGGSAKVDND